jgi:hypothetical protein
MPATSAPQILKQIFVFHVAAQKLHDSRPYKVYQAYRIISSLITAVAGAGGTAAIAKLLNLPIDQSAVAGGMIAAVGGWGMSTIQEGKLGRKGVLIDALWLAATEANNSIPNTLNKANGGQRDDALEDLWTLQMKVFHAFNQCAGEVNIASDLVTSEEIQRKADAKFMHLKSIFPWLEDNSIDGNLQSGVPSGGLTLRRPKRQP